MPWWSQNCWFVLFSLTVNRKDRNSCSVTRQAQAGFAHRLRFIKAHNDLNRRLWPPAVSEPERLFCPGVLRKSHLLSRQVIYNCGTAWSEWQPITALNCPSCCCWSINNWFISCFLSIKAVHQQSIMGVRKTLRTLREPKRPDLQNINLNNKCYCSVVQWFILQKKKKYVSHSTVLWQKRNLNKRVPAK